MRLVAKLCLIALLAGIAAPSARAANQWGEEDENPGEFGPTLGAGNWNCRHWLSSPASMKEGNSWIFGWWEATVAGDQKHPGANQIDWDEDKIIGLVRKPCLSDPAMALTNAVVTAYWKTRKNIGHHRH